MQLLNKFLFWIGIACLINFTQAQVITNEAVVQAGAQFNPGDTFVDGLTVNPNNPVARNLDGTNFTRTQGNRLTLHNVTGGQINFTRTTMPQLTITTPPATTEQYYQLQRINYGNAQVESLRIENTNLELPDFRDAIATGAVLQGESLYNGFFAGADLTDATINYNNITGLTTFVGATLRRTTIAGHLTETFNLFGVTTLEGADFTGIPVADLNRLNTIIQLFLNNNPDYNRGLRLPDGIRLTFFDRAFRPEQIAMLRFRDVTMNRVVLPDNINNWHFDGATINGTNFTHIRQAQNVTFVGTTMRGVILPANIDGWDFRGADLTGADFTQVRTANGARFAGAILTGADFTHLTLDTMREMDFAYTDITTANFPPIIGHLILNNAHGIFHIPAHFPFPPPSVQVWNSYMENAYFDVDDPTIIYLSYSPNAQYTISPLAAIRSWLYSLFFSDTDGAGSSYSANNQQSLMSNGKTLPKLIFLRSKPGNKFHGIKPSDLMTIRVPSLDDATFD